MIKRSILQEDMTVLNVYRFCIRASKYLTIKQKLPEFAREKDKYTMILEDFNLFL